jgi:dTDP-4-amino-4,6-dideoxygalactose transaminase
MFRFTPPAGSPIGFSELFSVFASCFRRADSITAARTGFGRIAGTTNLFFFNSGRSALYVVLAALRERCAPDRNEIIMPAYTCFSVAGAVARAGFKIRLADISPGNLDFDFDDLSTFETDRVAALIGCNLFGIPNNWSKLRHFAEERGLFLIDDAAQSLGTLVDGVPSGMCGDAGIYSFARGKNISACSGGALVANDPDIIKHVHDQLESFSIPSPVGEIRLLAEIASYSLFLRPRAHWLPQKLPFLRLGTTVYDDTFNVALPGAVLYGALATLLKNLERQNYTREENGSYLAKEILSIGSWEIPGYDPNASKIYLRLPVMAPDRTARESAISALRRHGIGASRMYPTTIQEIPQISDILVNPGRKLKGAQTVVDRLFTLPTHPYVKESDIVRIVNCLKTI